MGKRNGPIWNFKGEEDLVKLIKKVFKRKYFFFSKLLIVTFVMRREIKKNKPFQMAKIQKGERGGG